MLQKKGLLWSIVGPMLSLFANRPLGLYLALAWDPAVTFCLLRVVLGPLKSFWYNAAAVFHIGMTTRPNTIQRHGSDDIMKQCVCVCVCEKVTIISRDHQIDTEHKAGGGGEPKPRGVRL